MFFFSSRLNTFEKKYQDPFQAICLNKNKDIQPKQSMSMSSMARLPIDQAEEPQGIDQDSCSCQHLWSP